MATHLALLRGINVGGHGKLPMAHLREIVVGLGHADVATYIQSGNVVFTSQAHHPPADHAAALQQAIKRECGLAPVVVVREAQEWGEVIRADPYPADVESKTVHLAAQQEPIGDDQREAIEQVLREHQEADGPDHLTVIGTVTYLHTPGGIGRSRLAERLARVRNAGQDRATARNRASAHRLLDLLRE